LINIAKWILLIFSFYVLVIIFSLEHSFEKSINLVKVSSITNKETEKGSVNHNKIREFTLPPIYIPDASFYFLNKDVNLDRILLEKYFLLIQKDKLDRLKDPSSKVQEMKKFIQQQLKTIERELRRKEVYQFDQDFV